VESITENRFLDIFPFFRKGSQQLVSDILSSSEHKFLPANTILQLEGQLCHDLGLVVSGEQRIYKISESGREITLYEIGSGEICILNASCILSNSLCPATAESLTDVEILFLPAREFLTLIEKYEDMRTFIFTFINQILASTLELIVEIAFRRMDERLIDYLTKKSENGCLSTTHQKIARDLGTAREVVSRLLKDFERRDMVILSRNFIQVSNISRASPFLCD
jgi:CRP/FNR family transcriptional regulator